MNRHLLGAVVTGLVLVLTGGCVSDPTADLRTNTPTRLALSNRYLTLDVGDSIRVTVTALDAQGNQLAEQVSAAPLAPTVATTVGPSAPPVPGTSIFVKAIAFGPGQVEVSLGSLKDTIRVNNIPARVTITGQTDTLLGSGNSMQLGAQPLGAGGAPVPGVTPITWSSSNTAVAVVDATGLVTGQAPGIADITVTVPGGSTRVSFVVVPGVFAGTLSVSDADPGEEITITRAPGGPAMDADTRVTVRGRATFVKSFTADNIVVPMPPTELAGPVELQILNMGPTQIAQGTTITANSAGFADRYEPANDAPSTGPVVTNGDYYFILHGGCADVGNFVGEPINPGDECDDFFTITNSSGAAATVTLQVQWIPVGADIDFYVTNADFTAEIGSVFTTGNPETLAVSIPAATTFRIWINNYDHHGVVYSLARLRVSGLP